MEHIEFDAAQPHPQPKAAAPVEHTPQDAPEIVPVELQTRPEPQAGPKVMTLGGKSWPCIDEIPAGRIAEVIEQQVEMNDSANSDDPMKQAKAILLAMSLFEHFVEDDYLPALNAALKDKKDPIGLPEAVVASGSMITEYLRGDDTPKS